MDGTEIGIALGNAGGFGVVVWICYQLFKRDKEQRKTQDNHLKDTVKALGDVAKSLVSVSEGQERNAEIQNKSLERLENDHRELGDDHRELRQCIVSTAKSNNRSISKRKRVSKNKTRSK